MIANFSRRPLLHLPSSRLLSSQDATQQSGRLLAALDLQGGVVAHLDRLKAMRDHLGERDLRARVERILRF